MTNHVWTPAEVEFPDFAGTVALDVKRTGSTSLYTLTGLDRDQWRIIGLDWAGSEHGTHALRVVALPVGGDFHGYAEWHAVEFTVHDVDPFEVIRALTHVSAWQLRHRSTDGREVRIVAVGDTHPTS